MVGDERVLAQGSRDAARQGCRGLRQPWAGGRNKVLFCPGDGTQAISPRHRYFLSSPSTGRFFAGVPT